MLVQPFKHELHSQGKPVALLQVEVLGRYLFQPRHLRAAAAHVFIVGDLVRRLHRVAFAEPREDGPEWGRLLTAR